MEEYYYCDTAMWYNISLPCTDARGRQYQTSGMPDTFSSTPEGVSTGLTLMYSSNQCVFNLKIRLI